MSPSTLILNCIVSGLKIPTLSICEMNVDSGTMNRKVCRSITLIPSSTLIADASIVMENN
jgi:hypothetical protein